MLDFHKATNPHACGGMDLMFWRSQCQKCRHLIADDTAKGCAGLGYPVPFGARTRRRCGLFQDKFTAKGGKWKC